MAPRASKSQVDGDEPLKPKTEKARVIKAKAEKSDKSKNDKKDKDKGEKVKPVNGDEAVQLIAEYLKAQNRPYSATEVSANLHGKVSIHYALKYRQSSQQNSVLMSYPPQVTKTVADKLLKEMEQSNQIMGKATNGDKKGSQWVFWALQVSSHSFPITSSPL